MKRFLSLFFLFINFICVYSQIQETPFSGFYQTVVPNAMSCVITIQNEYESEKEKQYNIDYIREGNIVKYGNGYTDIIVEYNDKRQIAKYKQLLYEISEEYVYDEKGRILETISNGVHKTHYYYTETNTDSIVYWDYVALTDTWNKTSKNEITYDQSGYKVLIYNFNNETGNYDYWFTKEYLLDELDRIIEVKETDRLENNKWTYTYTENGFIYTVYQPASSAFCRTEYIFNENNDLSKSTYSEWTKNSYWNPVVTTTYEYDYTTGLSKLNVSEVDINININGKQLYINNPEKVDIAIYDMSGCKICEITKDVNIALPIGFYVIHYGDQSKKIVVK